MITHIPKTALFIDFDNIQIKASDLNLEHCFSSQLWSAPLISEIEQHTKGSVDIRRCYGNVMLNSSKIFKEKIYRTKDIRDLLDVDINLQSDLIKNGFQMIHTFGMGQSGKNRADILIALDSIEMALKHDQIEYIAVFTQDSDFTPLFHKLRALGKKIILVTIDEFKKASPSIKSLLSLVNLHITYNQEVIDKFGYNLLKQTLSKIEEEEPEAFNSGINLSSIHTRILQEDNTFDYENIGFSKLKEFIENCLQERYIVEKTIIKRNEKYRYLINNNEAKDNELELLQNDAKLLKITAVLKKQNIRINYHLIIKIKDYLLKTQTELFNQEQNQNSIPLASLYNPTVQEFHAQNYSKSHIRDALKALQVAKFIIVNEEEELPFAQKQSNIDPNINLEQNLANNLVEKIIDAGFNITEDDIKKISFFIFQEINELQIKLIKQALELSQQEEKE